MTHIIQKQTLELTLDEGPEKLVRQEDMVQRFRDEVLPALNAFFDELVPDGTVWKIDKLDVDLGPVKPEDFSKELIRHLKEKLQFDFQPGKGRSSLEVLSSNQSLLEQFLYFLKYGHFSWSANGITLEQMEKELPKAFENSDQREKAKILQELMQGRSLERFQTQFSLEFQITLVVQLLNIKNLKTLFRFLKEHLSEHVYRQTPKAAITAYASMEMTKKSQTFLLLFLRNLENIMAFSPAAKVKFRTHLVAKAKKESSDTAHQVVEALQKLQAEKTASADEKNEAGAKIAENMEDSIENIYIRNAGMVLFWPFLPRLFENMKLTEDGEFISRQAREKAICMLQFLVDPENGITENLLPMNKILCGLDVAELVPTDEIEISQEDAEIGDGLIKAVIQNWQKIGNTSKQGFQSSFLQRNGLLEKTEEGWKLAVERRTFDVLMDSLPWSITLIKLPWMPKPLYVQW